jgi:hypothetical protein
MASIYDKALKRKDFSGIVDNQKEKEKEKVGDGDGGDMQNGDGDGMSREFSFFSCFMRVDCVDVWFFVGCREE